MLKRGGGVEGGWGGAGGTTGGDGSVGTEGGAGGANGGTGEGGGQHSSQPADVALPSERQVMVPDATVTPAGPLEPQYLAPSIDR